MYEQTIRSVDEKETRRLAGLASHCAPRFNEHGCATTDRALTAQVYGSFLDEWEALHGPWRHCSLAVLAPNGVCHLHSDDPQARNRLMFVLQTNPDAWCFHDGHWQQLQLGGVYQVDATRPHAAVNLGTDLRIHLAVDLKD
jgi:hypothetical protein